MKKIYLSIILILTVVITYAQNFDVRKLTLKSDVILLYDQDSIAYIDELINDHTTNHFYQLKAVTQTVKNTVGFKYANTKLPYLVENEDYFKIYQKGDCLGIVGKAYDGVKRKFYGLLFLQKNDKKYNVIGIVQNDNSLPSWQDLIKQINSVSSLEKIKNLQERYTKSIDWFLDNNVLPDENFIKYYKQKAYLKQIRRYLMSGNWQKQKLYFLIVTKLF